MNVDIAVIGSGVSGLSVAAHAVDKGMKVCIIEANPLALEYNATSRSAGIATVQMEDTLDIRLAKRGIEIIEVWSRRYGLSSIKRTGLLTIDGVDELREYSSILNECNVRNTIYTSKEVTEWGWLNTNINEAIEEAYLYTYMDISMNPPEFFSSFAKELMNRGVIVLNGYGKVKINDDKEASVLVKDISSSDITHVKSNVVVLCAGAWLSKDTLTDHHDEHGNSILDAIRRNIQTYIVPLVFIRYGEDRAKIHESIIPFDDEITGTYWITRGKDMLVGGDYTAWRVDDVGVYDSKYSTTSLTIDRGYVEHVIDALSRRVRGIRLEYSKIHYGPINITSDSRPIVGAIPYFKNLYILDGLRGYGLARAPALAEMLVNSIDNNNKYIISEISVSRFLDN
jgi:glycine/D-amino acid oxidase-like deaminating enzyme